MSFLNEAANVLMMKSNKGKTKITFPQSIFNCSIQRQFYVLCFKQKLMEYSFVKAIRFELHNLHHWGSKCLVKVNNDQS